PPLPLQLPIVGLLEIRHPHQPPIVAIGPAMIGAGEGLGIAPIGPAEAITPMAAHIEKGMDLSLAVSSHENRVFAHGGAEEVARLGDLALMAQKQPAAGEDLLQLLLVDPPLDEDAPADQAPVGIDQTADVRYHEALLMP